MGSGGEVGDPLVQHPDVKVVSFTGSTEVGPADLAGLRADVQAPAPRDGRQERDPRDGRRRRRPRGRRRGLGRLRHDRPALHGVLAPARAPGRLRRVPREARRARRRRSGSATASTTNVDMGPCVSAKQRETVAKYVEIGEGGGREAPRRRREADGGALGEGLVPRADGLRRRRREDARSRCEEIFGPVDDGGSDHLARGGDPDRQLRGLRTLRLDLHAATSTRPSSAMRDIRDRNLLRELLDDRRRGAPALRRHQGHGQRPPRGRRRRRSTCSPSGSRSTSTSRASCRRRRSTRTEGPEVGRPEFGIDTAEARTMIVGVPKEIKDNENRVGHGAGGRRRRSRRAGHKVLVETTRARDPGITDDQYVAAGRADSRRRPTTSSPGPTWSSRSRSRSAPEYQRLRAGQILYTYLHLAPAKALTEKLLERKVARRRLRDDRARRRLAAAPHAR